MIEQEKYIVTDEQIKIWRTGCINLSNPHTDDNTCEKCQYRGKGARHNCCDFDDTAMERIFRSTPVNESRIKNEGKIPEEVSNEIREWLEHSMQGIPLFMAFGGMPATRKWIESLGESK